MKRFALLTGALVVTATASATEINFDGLGLLSGGAIPSSLGSNATSATTGVAIGSGWTPNVAVSMETYNSSGTTISSHLLFWTTGYGNLIDIAYPSLNGAFGRIKLTADAGFNVVLESFDVGSWPGVNRVTPILRATDGTGNVLWNMDGFTVPGAGHTNFAPNITAQSVWLEWGNDWSIGLDNIRFSQTNPVPEPATMAALGFGALALARKRRRK